MIDRDILILAVDADGLGIPPMTLYAGESITSFYDRVLASFLAAGWPAETARANALDLQAAATLERDGPQ